MIRPSLALILLLLLALDALPPTIAIDRQAGGALEVAVIHRPPGGCVSIAHPGGAEYLLGCADRLLLAWAGVDSAYQPRPGRSLILRDGQGRMLATRAIPPFRAALPVVAR